MQKKAQDASYGKYTCLGVPKNLSLLGMSYNGKVFVFDRLHVSCIFMEHDAQFLKILLYMN